MPTRLAASDVEVQLAATILLVRDTQRGLEVFMLERNLESDFARGALVFPGGRVDPGDRAEHTRAYCSGGDDLDDAALTLRVTAIRETFEECGVLLARRRSEQAASGAPTGLITSEELAQIERRYRAALVAADVTMAKLAEAEDLELACDLLVPFAHWITPKGPPKRFDTHFFLAAAPRDHVALHDGEESVDSLWTTVEDAREAERSGDRTIVFPTMMNLRKLGRSTRVRDALEAARSAPVVTVEPRIVRGDDGKAVLHLPKEAGYDVVEAPLDSIRRQ